MTASAKLAPPRPAPPGRALAALLASGGLALGTAACTDLDLEPETTTTPGVYFVDGDAYESSLARVYSGLAVTGQRGPLGAADISSLDEGFSSYLRQYWQLQELPTDNAVIAWGDDGLAPLQSCTWTSQNQFVRAMYYRVFFQVSLANEFLRESAPGRLDARGIDDDDRARIAGFRAEARFLRALSLWHGLDFFGAIPLYDESQAVGGDPPRQAPPREVFDFVLAELDAIEDALPGIGQAEYARADRGALLMLRANLLLNAEAYVGQDRYADALAAAEAIVDADAYALDPDYGRLFGADNDLADGVIFPVAFDGESTQTWGGTAYLVHAPLGGSMVDADYGVTGAWQGLRTTPGLVERFGGEAFDTTDSRAIFFTDGQSYEVGELTDFTDGYAVPKWTNLRADGTPGSNVNHPDTDYPLFRLAEAYLLYAEAHLRGGGGSRERALDLVNAVRARAYVGDDEEGFLFGRADLTLDNLLDERQRELYWEGHRRRDLIRFGLFAGEGYLWAFKGGVPGGTGIPDFRRLYPIPATEFLANPNLTQNAGY